MSRLTKDNDTSENADRNEEKAQDKTTKEMEENTKVENPQWSEKCVCTTTDDMDIKANALLEGLRKLKDEIRQERIKRKYSENSPTMLIRETKENTHETIIMENDKTDQEKLRRHKHEEDTENKRESEDDDDDGKEDQNEVRKNTEFKEKIKQIWIEEHINEKIKEQLEKFKERKELEKNVDEQTNLGTDNPGNLDDTVQYSLNIENVHDNEIQDDPHFPEEINHETNEETVLKNDMLETLITKMHKVFKREIDTDNEIQDNDLKVDQDFPQDNSHETNEDTLVKNDSLEKLITKMNKVFRREIDTDNEIQDNDIKDDQDFPQDNNHETNEETNEETVVKNTDSLETLITKMNKVFKRETDTDNEIQDNDIKDDQDFTQDNNHETNEETNEETVVKKTDSLETLIIEMNKVFKREIDILLNKKTS